MDNMRENGLALTVFRIRVLILWNSLGIKSIGFLVLSSVVFLDTVYYHNKQFQKLILIHNFLLAIISLFTYLPLTEEEATT